MVNNYFFDDLKELSLGFLNRVLFRLVANGVSNLQLQFWQKKYILRS